MKDGADIFGATINSCMEIFCTKNGTGEGWGIRGRMRVGMGWDGMGPFYEACSSRSSVPHLHGVDGAAESIRHQDREKGEIHFNACGRAIRHEPKRVREGVSDFGRGEFL